MKIWRNAYEAGRLFPASVTVIGKFDGLHQGHRRVLRAAVRRARALKTSCLVLSFDPLPEEFLNERRRLVPLPRLIEWLRGLGVDGVVLLPFNDKLACLSPEAFAKDILANALRVLEVVVGSDFCYGRDRAGRVDDLREQGRSLGFAVRSVPLLRLDGQKVTPALIVRLVAEKKTKQAKRLLGIRKS